MSLTIYHTEKEIIEAFDATEKEASYIKSRIEKAGCWGFITDRDVSVYCNGKETKEDLLELFSHEISHKYTKSLKKLSDENFCTMNARICLMAYQLMMRTRV